MNEARKWIKNNPPPTAGTLIKYYLQYRSDCDPVIIISFREFKDIISKTVGLEIYAPAQSIFLFVRHVQSSKDIGFSQLLRP
jgi:hypothetical protein